MTAGRGAWGCVVETLIRAKRSTRARLCFKLVVEDQTHSHLSRKGKINSNSWEHIHTFCGSNICHKNTGHKTHGRHWDNQGRETHKRRHVKKHETIKSQNVKWENYSQELWKSVSKWAEMIVIKRKSMNQSSLKTPHNSQRRKNSWKWLLSHYRKSVKSIITLKPDPHVHIFRKGTFLARFFYCFLLCKPVSWLQEANVNVGECLLTREYKNLLCEFNKICTSLTLRLDSIGSCGRGLFCEFSWCLHVCVCPASSLSANGGI